MSRGVLCGVAAAASVVVTAAAAGPASSACRRGTRAVGNVTAVGCWSGAGPRWQAATPVTVNGMTLAGGGSVVVDTAAGTLRSTAAVRWQLGAVQIRRAPFAWKRGSTLSFKPLGAVQGLAFRGSGTLSFTRSRGGTTRVATRVTVPIVAGGVSGDAVLTVSRRAGFDVRRVRVSVAQVPFSRLVLKRLAFAYDAGTWSADAEAALPAFSTSELTIKGHVAFAHGHLTAVGIGADGLRIPLSDGFFLTEASLTVDPFDPLGLAGDATGTFGPPLAGSAALQVHGKLAYASQAPESWSAGGDVSLPWLPVFTPKVTGEVGIQPGRAMTFKADVDVTVHHWGVTGSLKGFVTGSAFNAEGSAELSIPGPDLKGVQLFSSKGMAACAKIFFGPRVGFGYSWGGAIDVLHSSCDVGRWRVTRTLASARIAPQDVTVPAELPFETFAARGTNVVVSGPSGVFDSTLDRNGPDAFVTHDPDDGWAFVIVPTPLAGTYHIAPVGTGTIAEVDVGDGLEEPSIVGNVSATGTTRTLGYGIGGLVPGETVSFYEGQALDVAGASPIAEDVVSNGNGTASFAPEALGSSSRAVFAVVAIDGRPRAQQLVAVFDSAPVAGPALGGATIAASTASRQWEVTIANPTRVDHVEGLVVTDDGDRSFVTLPSRRAQGPVPVAPLSTHVTVRLVPYDVYGRAGGPLVCDSATPGPCTPA